ncbi:MAG: DVU0772 family protein [Eubacteriales bacterium]|nr:hypothetical protein [Bacillota bacterium]
MDVEKIKQNLDWDYNFEKEQNSINRSLCYTFAVDVFESTPRLVLYAVKRNGSMTDDLDEQPPREMLLKAVVEQGGSLDKSRLYKINEEVRRWIEDNFLSMAPGC